MGERDVGDSFAVARKNPLQVILPVARGTDDRREEVWQRADRTIGNGDPWLASSGIDTRSCGVLPAQRSVEKPSSAIAKVGRIGRRLSKK